MKYLKIFDSFDTKEKLSFSELNEDDILTHLIDKIDNGDIKLEFLEEVYWNESGLRGVINLYNRDNINLESDIESICVGIELKHPYMVRNNSFDYDNYAKQLIIQYFKRFFDNYDVNIFCKILDSNPMDKYFCKALIVIQENKHDVRYNQVLKPGGKVIRESKDTEEIEEIEDYFIELIDHSNDKIPINVEVSKHKVSKNSLKIDGYKISIIYDIYDQLFVDKVVETAIKRLKFNYNIHYNQISKKGNGYTYREIPVYGTNRVSPVSDPRWKRTITISPKIIKESFLEDAEDIILYYIDDDFFKIYGRNCTNTNFELSKMKRLGWIPCCPDSQKIKQNDKVQGVSIYIDVPAYYTTCSSVCDLVIKKLSRLISLYPDLLIYTRYSMQHEFDGDIYRRYEIAIINC